jgi:predicted ribosomally synthesized peptide with nif11-like leader
MSKQSLDAFRAKLAEDETLRQEVSRTFGGSDGRTIASADQLVAFAKAHGYEFNPDEVQESVELSDKELDSVAGGAIDTFLKLDGIDGEASFQHKHIDILSWSWGVSNTTTSLR